MKAKPIIFSGPMVRALLEGRKTQTRRIMKPQPVDTGVSWQFSFKGKRSRCFSNIPYGKIRRREFGIVEYCPYGKTGDLLYVRETSKATYNFDKIPCVRYEADQVWKPCFHGVPFVSWCDMHHYRAGAGLQVPAIHQPRWASRITLEITDVRVERVQDISEADAAHEGAMAEDYEAQAGEGYSSRTCYHHGQPTNDDGEWFDTPKQSFVDLWKSINGKDSWDTNPFVWVMTFKVHQTNVDKMISEKVAA